MTLLYDTFKEYSRVHEELALTEDGLFIKDEIPEDYGGAVLTVWVVHTVHMVNAGGIMQTLEFTNESPRNKQKQVVRGPVTIDGRVPVPPENGMGREGGIGPTRKWVTQTNSYLPQYIKNKGDITMGIRSSAP